MNRWYRLAAAVAAMIMIGNLQYAWTLFVQPMISATGWKLSEVQWGYSFFIAMMTWTMPLSGWLIDRMGPRLFMTAAGVLCALGWGGLSQVTTLREFYALYALAGLGNAFVYCCSIAVGLKWFQDKRGLAAGIIAAGYGSGAALFNPIFAYMIGSMGHRATFLYTGIGLGVMIILAGQFLKNPEAGEAAAAAPTKPVVRRQNENFNSAEMLRTPQFYFLYAMMLMIGIGGLMVTAQLAPVAKSFKIGATALTIALSLNPIGNGVGRIGWGWVSDHVGRERTMALAFFLQSIFLVAAITIGRWGDVWFVVSMALVFLTWGELYVLFPAVLTDFFGAKNSASNYSFLYSTKGVASLLGGGLAAMLFEATGTWDYAFYGSAVLAFLTSIGCLALLKVPLPSKASSRQAVAAGSVAASR